MTENTLSTRAVANSDMLDALCRQVQENPSDFVTLTLPDGSEAALVDKTYLTNLVGVVGRLEQFNSGSAGDENFYLEVSPQTVDELFSVLDAAVEQVKQSTLNLINKREETDETAE